MLVGENQALLPDNILGLDNSVFVHNDSSVQDSFRCITQLSIEPKNPIVSRKRRRLTILAFELFWRTATLAIDHHARELVRMRTRVLSRIHSLEFIFKKIVRDLTGPESQRSTT